MKRNGLIVLTIVIASIALVALLSVPWVENHAWAAALLVLLIIGGASVVGRRLHRRRIAPRATISLPITEGVEGGVTVAIEDFGPRRARVADCLISIYGASWEAIFQIMNSTDSSVVIGTEMSSMRARALRDHLVGAGAIVSLQERDDHA